MKVIGQSMATTGNHLLLFVHDKRGGGRWTSAESIGLPGLGVDDAKAPYDTYCALIPLTPNGAGPPQASDALREVNEVGRPGLGPRRHRGHSGPRRATEQINCYRWSALIGRTYRDPNHHADGQHPALGRRMLDRQDDDLRAVHHRPTSTFDTTPQNTTGARSSRKNGLGASPHTSCRVEL